MKILDPQRLTRAFGHSMKGLQEAFQKETACQQELILLFVLTPIVFFLDVTVPEKVLLIASLLLVLIVEILNTAIETIVNLVSPAQHPLAKYAKDLGSAAVFLSLILGLLVWAALLGNRYLF
ncbi:MAG: diacylglycerol kinase [Alphaproteobacteria bacterium]